MKTLLLLLVGATIVSGIDEEAASPPTGFIWLVSGCSISSYLHRLTRTLFDEFVPQICARDAREMYNPKRMEAGYNPDEMTLVDYVVHRDDELFGDCPENRSRFVIGKMTYKNYLESTNDFIDRPSFILASAIRANIPEFLACLLRDQSDHDFTLETGLPLEKIGYVVDAESGEEWHHKATAFREDKDQSSVYFRTGGLPTFLDRVYAALMLSHRKVLLDTHVDGTVYNTEDLTDFSTEQKQRSAAELWVTLLARAGALANVNDVMNALRPDTTVPCDLRRRIFNLDEVRQALNGTLWERHVYCPDEWNARTHSAYDGRDKSILP